jgi:hypothetical protein
MALAAVAAMAAAGCSKPQAKIRYMTGGADETVTYDMALFQLAKGSRVQIILYRRTAAPVGEADPDFEYTFFELPERPHYGWVKDDNVPAYRWVRQDGRDRLWRGTSGQVNLSPGGGGQHMHFDFQVTMEPLDGTSGGVYVLGGAAKCTEDLVASQGLINRYGDWLLSLLGQAPKSPAGPKVRLPLNAGSQKPAKKK